MSSIRLLKTAYKIGFSCAFEENLNEISARRMFSFSESHGERHLKNLYSQFHKGYFDCKELIKTIDLISESNKKESIFDSIVNDYKNILKKQGFTGL